MLRRPGRAVLAVAASLVLVAVAVAIVLLTRADHGPRPAPIPGIFGYDPGRSLDVKTTSFATVGGVPVTELTYAGYDGQRVPALLATPGSGAPRRGCLVLEPQLGATKESTSALWAGIAAVGLSTFSIDPRDSGARVSDPAATLDAVRQDPRRIRRLLIDSVRDLRRGLDYLETRSECHHRIAVLGISLGGALDAMLAGSDHRVRAAVLVSTGPSWRQSTEVRDPLVLPGLAAHPKRLDAAVALLAPLDPARWVARIAPRPVMLINGRSDALIPPSAQRALVAAAGAPKVVVRYDGGHDPYASPDASSVGRRIARFLAQHVVGGTATG